MSQSSRTYYTNCKYVPLKNIYPILPLHPLITIILFCFFKLIFLDSTYRIYHTVFVFLCQTLSFHSCSICFLFLLLSYHDFRWLTVLGFSFQFKSGRKEKEQCHQAILLCFVSFTSRQNISQKQSIRFTFVSWSSEFIQFQAQSQTKYLWRKAEFKWSNQFILWGQVRGLPYFVIKGSLSTS